jgi:hypothetical protein
MLVIAGIHSSIPFDYLVKSTGKQNLHGLLNEMPSLIPDKNSLLHVAIAQRSLALNAVSKYYNSLLDEFECDFDIKVNPLKNHLERRKAIIEIDVLTSISFGLSLEDLQTVYRSEFWVLYQNEQDTYYDSNGRIVFTPSKGLVGVGLPRTARKSDLADGTRYGIQSADRNEQGIALGWNDIAHMATGTVSKTFMDDTLPGGPREKTIEYVAPFFKPDREEDYRVAWGFFEGEQ